MFKKTTAAATVAAFLLLAIATPAQASTPFPSTPGLSASFSTADPYWHYGPDPWQRLADVSTVIPSGSWTGTPTVAVAPAEACNLTSVGDNAIMVDTSGLDVYISNDPWNDNADPGKVLHATSFQHLFCFIVSTATQQVYISRSLYVYDLIPTITINSNANSSTISGTSDQTGDASGNYTGLVTVSVAGQTLNTHVNTDGTWFLTHAPVATTGLYDVTASVASENWDRNAPRGTAIASLTLTASVPSPVVTPVPKANPVPVVHPAPVVKPAPVVTPVPVATPAPVVDVDIYCLPATVAAAEVESPWELILLWLLVFLALTNIVLTATKRRALTATNPAV